LRDQSCRAWSLGFRVWGLVFKAHRRLNHSTLGLSVIKKKRRVWGLGCTSTCLSLLFAAGGSASCGGKAGSLIRKHDHFTPTREIRRHVRALARNHPGGCAVSRWGLSLQGSGFGVWVNGSFSDLRFTLPDPGIPRVCPSFRPCLYQVFNTAGEQGGAGKERVLLSDETDMTD